MMSLRHVQLVRGVPTLSAEYKRARVLAAGHDFEVLDLTTQRCQVRGRRAGAPKWLEITFTMDDAKRAGLLAPSKSGRPGAWQTRPRRMLFARAGSELCDFIFADVTNGLPTAELVAAGVDDDEFAGYNESPTQAAPADADGDGHPAAPPRTARRRTSPKAAETPSARAGERSVPARAEGPPQPPLPGEDEPDPTQPAGPAGSRQSTGSSTAPAADGHSEPDERDYDTPGTATTPQITAIWTVLGKVYQFTGEEKEQARAVCAHVLGRDLPSTKDMSRNEAKAVLDTLGNWREMAERNRMTAREFLIEFMAAEAEQHAQDAAEAGDTGESGHDG